jgi:hypothetical protein
MAQDAYCINPSTRQIDAQGTAAWQQLAQQQALTATINAAL